MTGLIDSGPSGRNGLQYLQIPRDSGQSRSVDTEYFSIPNEMVHHQLGMYSQDNICSILKIDNAYLFAKIYLRKIVWLPRPSFGLLLRQYEYYPQIITGYIFLNVNS